MKKLHQAHLQLPLMMLSFKMSLEMMMTFLLDQNFSLSLYSEAKIPALAKVSLVWMVQLHPWRLNWRPTSRYPTFHQAMWTSWPGGKLRNLSCLFLVKLPGSTCVSQPPQLLQKGCSLHLEMWSPSSEAPCHQKTWNSLSTSMRTSGRSRWPMTVICWKLLPKILPQKLNKLNLLCLLCFWTESTQESNLKERKFYHVLNKFIFNYCHFRH